MAEGPPLKPFYSVLVLAFACSALVAGMVVRRRARALSALGLSYWLWPVFAGTATGYLFYDLTHYATHHFPMRSGYLKFLKRYHMHALKSMNSEWDWFRECS